MFYLMCINIYFPVSVPLCACSFGRHLSPCPVAGRPSPLVGSPPNSNAGESGRKVAHFPPTLLRPLTSGSPPSPTSRSDITWCAHNIACSMWTFWNGLLITRLLKSRRRGIHEVCNIEQSFMLAKTEQSNVFQLKKKEKKMSARRTRFYPCVIVIS